MSRTFSAYLSQGYGLCANLGVLLLVATPAVLLAYFRVFVMHWVPLSLAQQAHSSWQLLFSILIPLILLSGGLGGVLISAVFLKAGDALHHSMLTRLTRAPISFFSSHPVGRILNRFSKDTTVADMLLVRQLLMVFQVGPLS